MKKKILILGGMILGTFFAATPLLRAHCGPFHTREERKEGSETPLKKVKSVSSKTVSSSGGAVPLIVTGVTS